METMTYTLNTRTTTGGYQIIITSFGVMLWGFKCGVEGVGGGACRALQPNINPLSSLFCSLVMSSGCGNSQQNGQFGRSEFQDSTLILLEYWFNWNWLIILILPAYEPHNIQIYLLI